jgi:hypothetical protein
MAHGPLKKSARVILTVAAAMGVAARGQQGADPCLASTFNAQVCKVAIRHKGYCSGGAFVKTAYAQPYPYYYDSYSTFVAGGGLAAQPESCSARGGFGSHGATRRAGS